MNLFRAALSDRHFFCGLRHITPLRSEQNRRLADVMSLFYVALGCTQSLPRLVRADGGQTLHCA